MSKRAETLMWEALPAGRWISQSEMREILRNKCGFRGATDGVVDNAVQWLITGKYVAVRNTIAYRPPRSGFIAGALPPPAPPRFEYWKAALEDIPLEADLQRAAEDRARGAAELKAAGNAVLDARLKELGLLPNEPTPQEA
jgi:hypothetical protein